MPRDLKRELNHMAPTAWNARLGDILNDIITDINAVLAVLDASGGLIAATEAATIGSAVNGQTFTLTFINPQVASLVSPGVSVTVTAGASDTTTTIAAALAAAIAASSTLAAAGITASAALAVVTHSQPGTVGNSTTVSKSGTGTITLANAGVLAGGLGTVGNTNAATLHVKTLAERAALLAN